MKHVLIIFKTVVLLSATIAVQASQAKPALTLQNLAGRYEGTSTSAQGSAVLTGDLRVVSGKLVGTFTSEDGPIAVLGATLTGDLVVLHIGLGGLAGTISGLAKNGRIDGEWALGGVSGKCVLVRTGDARPVQAVAQAPAKSQPFATHPKLEVVVPDFSAQGLILDIGGGGEGVIAQLKGRQVVAIDLSKKELDDAPGQPLLKIVMDARDLKFLDASFPTATVFFTFMYIDPADHQNVFREIHRVLEPNGRVLVWDVIFPEKANPNHANILFPLHATLPNAEITTGYGVRFRLGQGADHFVGLAEKAGFQVAARRNEAGWFFLELRK